MTKRYRTLRAAPSDKGVLSVVIDAPPMNLVGPELVRDLVTVLSELESDANIRVMVLESADPDYFIPHVDLTKVAEYTAEAARAGGPGDASLGMLWHKLSELPVVTVAKIRAWPAGWAANWRWRVTCGSPRGRTPSWARSRSAPARSRVRAACSTWSGCWAGAGPWR
jgi:enoyl-CoA hydratase/carnithine racemase